MGHKLEQAIAILNGAVGHYLAATSNGLAVQMSLMHEGAALPLERAALARAHPQATGRVVVLTHGVMSNESVWRQPDGDDYGAQLARDLGFTPYYVRYNSGLSIADNGAAYDGLLTALVDAHPVPVEELVLLGYSMGGLVARSACHAAGLAHHPWLDLVTRAVYVGTPHQGAPMERIGRVVSRVLRAVPDPYTQLIADVSDLRSEGIQDLGDADLRHDDRARRLPRYRLRDPRHPVPLLASMRHYLVAGTLHEHPLLAALFGDAVVPVRSARNQGDDAPLPSSRVQTLARLNHLDLPRRREVYEHIRAWCAEPLTELPIELPTEQLSEQLTEQREEEWP